MAFPILTSQTSNRVLLVGLLPRVSPRPRGNSFVFSVPFVDNPRSALDFVNHVPVSGWSLNYCFD